MLARHPQGGPDLRICRNRGLGHSSKEPVSHCLGLGRSREQGQHPAPKPDLVGQWKDQWLGGWGRGASPPAEVPAHSHELEGQARPALKPAAYQLWVSGVHF